MENQLSDFNFDLDIESVLNFMCYADTSKARPKIRAMAEEALTHANEYADSWACAVEVPLCGIKETEIYLKRGAEEQVCLRSEQLPKILRKADAVTILLVTAGQKITDKSKEFLDAGKLTQALAYSAVGSAMVVDLMKALTDKVYAQAQEKNYGITLRVGPGYTGWHLNDQSTLFSFFEKNKLPITLSHGVMMQPAKSLLGMVGMNPGGKRAPEIEPCRICDLKGCDMRKAPFRGFDGQSKPIDLKDGRFLA